MAEMTRLHEAVTRIDAYITQTLTTHSSPGVAIAVTDREHVQHVGAYGVADLATRTPITPHTRFEIGSISKSVTAIALLQQYDAGRVDLHAPVTHYLPWFPVPSGAAPITVHHLLSHTAGLVMGSDVAPDPRALVVALRETALATPPGTYFHYSDAGYQTLGLLVEEISGQTYAEVIQAGLLTPLDMAASEPVITHDTRRRLAVGYHSLYDDRPAHASYPLAPAPWVEWRGGDACVVSTATDMAAYLRLLLNAGQGPGERVLSTESFALLTHRAVPAAEFGAGVFYGYGLMTQEVAGHTYLFHEGGMPGYRAMLLADLTDGLGVIVLLNGPGAPATVARFTLEVLRAARSGQDLPPVPPATDPRTVTNAGDYTGTYASLHGQMVLTREGTRLVLQCEGHSTALEPRGPDTFYTPHPPFALFPWRFGRVGTEVVDASHGAAWYIKEGVFPPPAAASPPVWEGYAGHYRAYNPWRPNFRVVVRQGRLLLVEPSGDEEVLVEVEPGCFRIGAEEFLPERLCFETFISGQALRATLSGCPYYRVSTP